MNRASCAARAKRKLPSRGSQPKRSLTADTTWSTTVRQTRHRNPAFLWITAGALALLSLALGIPAVATLFRFTAPSPTLLILAGTLTAMAWLWFSWVNVRQARLGHAD